MKSFSFSLLVLITALFFQACGDKEKPDIEDNLAQYIAVWNGDSLQNLDRIADNHFQLKMPPDNRLICGIENLKHEIEQTRLYFPDFHLEKTEQRISGDSIVVIAWKAKGTFKNQGNMEPKAGKINVPGFSVIFFHNGKISGEWIAYSDLTWYKQLGFTLSPPQKTDK